MLPDVTLHDLKTCRILISRPLPVSSAPYRTWSRTRGRLAFLKDHLASLIARHPAARRATKILFWAIVIMGSLLVVHTAVWAVYKRNGWKMPRLLPFPRLEVYFAMFMLAPICTCAGSACRPLILHILIATVGQAHLVTGGVAAITHWCHVLMLGPYSQMSALYDIHSGMSRFQCCGRR